jgi:L-aspartate oxidase
MEVRHLPAVEPRWERSADVVVIGSGAAGMSAALQAAAHGLEVLLLTKGQLGGGATPLAQGGLAAAIGPGDSAALHAQDTLVAGAGLSDPAAVALLTARSPAEIERLAELGARLERTPLHLEGGHSRRRVLHAGGDAAGAEVHRTLLAALLASPVKIISNAAALDALTDERGRAGGVLVALTGDGELSPGVVTARAVVVATGGYGQVFARTTSPAGLTGDGLALAARAGAELRDLEFVQFHPTVLWGGPASGQCGLITEALRGAGAVLVDAAGQPVMAGLHPLGDLAPRDVVAAAMRERMDATGASHLWLDATGLGRRIEAGFPTVTAMCRALGIDPVTEPIPVVPGAHYSCGGIAAGLDGTTSVPGLLAVGEAASTGVHGANRLASNSLTESLITGRRAGDRLGRELPEQARELRVPRPGPGASAAGRPGLAAEMSGVAGVLRDRAGLERLAGRLERVPAAATVTLATAEATSLHVTATLVTAAALSRAESRGCHRWRDRPAASDGRALHSVLRVRDGQVVVALTGQAGRAERGLAGAGGRR